MYAFSVKDGQREISVGLVGCGRIGIKHAKILSNGEVPTLNLVAVCDVNESKSIEFSRLFGVQSFHSTDEMLKSKELDLVIVATHTGDHFSTAKAVLENGINVVIEKPITLRREQGEQLVDLAKKKNSRVFVVMQNRMNPAIQFAHRLLLENAIGRIRAVSVEVFWKRDRSYYEADDWRGTWDKDGGALLNQAIHHLDIVQWLFGMPISVQAVGGKFENPRSALDTVFAILQFDGGEVCSFQVCTATQPTDIGTSLTILGSHGNIRIGGASFNIVKSIDSSLRPNISSLASENSTHPENVYGLGHKDFLELVALDLLNGGSRAVDGTEGLKSLTLASSILASIEKGTKIFLQGNIPIQSTRLGYK